MLGIGDLLRTERSFRRVWLAQVVSELGDWFQIVAVMSMFPTRGEGTALVTSIYVGRHLVAALTTPLAGVVADRFHRGRVMIACDAARMLVALAFLGVRGPGDVAAVIALSLLLEALATIFEPARGAAIPQIVPTEKLFAANALAGATWSAVLALGSMAGGFTAAMLGRRAAFAINAASFAASALLVLAARIPALPPLAEGAPKPHPLRDAKEGLAYLRGHPAQASILGVKSGALLSGGFFVLVTVFSDQVFPGDNALTMGWLLGGRGSGALVLPLFLVRLWGTDVRGLGRVLLLAFPLAIVAFSAFSLAPSVPLAVLALVFAHGGTSTAWTSSTQLLQRTVPNRVLGRVLAVELMLVTLAVGLSGSAVAAMLRAGLPARACGLVVAGSLAIPLALWARAYARHARTLEEASRAR